MTEKTGKTKKKEYRKPTVQDWGTVAELTAVGNTHPANDAKGGSVNPPGHGG